MVRSPHVCFKQPCNKNFSTAVNNSENLKKKIGTKQTASRVSRPAAVNGPNLHDDLDSFYERERIQKTHFCLVNTSPELN